MCVCGSSVTYGVGYPLALAVAGELCRLAADRRGRSGEDLVNGNRHRVSYKSGRVRSTAC